MAHRGRSKAGGGRGGGRLRRWLWRLGLGLAVFTLLPVLLLRWIPPPTSSVMLQDRLGRLLHGEPSRPVRYGWVAWRTIAPAARLAVVAGEDQKFSHHWGFDFNSIEDAVEEAPARGRLRGASTISQQVARNLFLWQGRSWLRKGLEAYFTILLEACWPKRRILEVYLNVAQFGDGIYGVGAASRAFFGKPPRALQPPEAALLAAVLPNPKRLHVASPSAYVRERAAWIEEQMGLLGPAYLKGL